MTFWIFIGLVVIFVGIGAWVGREWGDWVDALLGGLAGAFLSGVILGSIFTLLALLVGVEEENPVVTSTYHLSPMDSGDTFLLDGMVGRAQMITYVRENGATLGVHQSPIWNSEIVETSGEPRVEVTKWEGRTDWVAPFGLKTWYTYKFFVPGGSIFSVMGVK